MADLLAGIIGVSLGEVMNGRFCGLDYLLSQRGVGYQYLERTLVLVGDMVP